MTLAAFFITFQERSLWMTSKRCYL